MGNGSQSNSLLRLAFLRIVPISELKSPGARLASFVTIIPFNKGLFVSFLYFVFLFSGVWVLSRMSCKYATEIELTFVSNAEKLDPNSKILDDGYYLPYNHKGLKV